MYVLKDFEQPVVIIYNAILHRLAECIFKFRMFFVNVYKNLVGLKRLNKSLLDDTQG